MADAVRSWRIADASITNEHHHHVSAGYDDTPLRAQIVALESRCSGLASEVAALRMTLDQVIAGYKQCEADLLQIQHNLASHTHEPIRSAAA